jgi:hypothetical protein
MVGEVFYFVCQLLNYRDTSVAPTAIGALFNCSKSYQLFLNHDRQMET